MQPEVSYPTTDGRSTVAEPAAAPGLGGAWDSSLAGLRRDDQRVENVFFRLQAANAGLCDDTAPVAGLILQSALQYRPQLRAAAKAALGLDDRPSVEVVATGGPAELAGVKPGDVLVAIDGAPVGPVVAPRAAAPDVRPATYAPVSEANAALTRALAAGPARVTVLRGRSEMDLVLRPVLGCAYEVQVLPGSQPDASADGRYVTITSAMVSYAETDDTLALVLGHELAHDLLHHHERLRAAGAPAASSRLAEREADYVGLYLTARAGYDISQAPGFWSAARRAPLFDLSHPSDAERALMLVATRDEILKKEHDGSPLTPNPSPGRPALGTGVQAPP